MLSQSSPNLATSPPAFWMSDSMPASSNAFCRLGRSLASQRGEVVASGRITPTLPPELAAPAVAASPLLRVAVAAARSERPKPARHRCEGRETRTPCS